MVREDVHFLRASVSQSLAIPTGWRGIISNYSNGGASDLRKVMQFLEGQHDLIGCANPASNSCVCGRVRHRKESSDMIPSALRLRGHELCTLASEVASK